MAQMLGRVGGGGPVRRTQNPSDGRSSRVALTEVARARLPNAMAMLFQGNVDAPDGFSDDEVVRLVALLTRLIAILDAVAGAEAPLTPSRAEAGG